MTTLHRMLRVGDCISFDRGRIAVYLEEKSGRNARLTLVLHDDVVVDKPRTSSNDEPRDNRRGILRGDLRSS